MCSLTGEAVVRERRRRVSDSPSPSTKDFDQAALRVDRRRHQLDSNLSRIRGMIVVVKREAENF
jgi:hypothetical protein